MQRFTLLSLKNGASVALPDNDNAAYLKYLDNLNKLRKQLTLLRLRGDEFKIIQKQENKVHRVI
jgi:hypothetical protein